MKDAVIEISASTIFKAILIVGLFWLLYFFRDLVLVLLTAVVIASSIEPLTRWFMRYRVPRVIAVIAIYLTFAILISGLFYFFLPSLLQDASGFLNIIPNYLETLESGESIGSGLFGDIGKGISISETIEGFRETLSVFSGGVFASLSTVFGGLFSFILIIVLSFYLSVQEKGIEKFLRLITPSKHEGYIIDLWERSQKKIGLWMQGQLLLAFIVGVLVYLGLTVLQVKYALALSVFAAFFEIIPLFGPIIAAIPAVAIGFGDSVTLGLMVLGLFVIIQQFENHLIYPLVVRKVVGISPIMVIIALIIGGKLAGFLGILLAVPIAAAIMEFADDVERRKLLETEKEKKSK